MGDFGCNVIHSSIGIKTFPYIIETTVFILSISLSGSEAKTCIVITRWISPNDDETEYAGECFEFEVIIEFKS